MTGGTAPADENTRERGRTGRSWRWTSRGLTAALGAVWLLAAAYVVTREVTRDETDAETGAETAVEDSESVGGERSPEEIAARGEADAAAAPAEPGEMVVDEAVVDEVVEEDGESESEAGTEGQTEPGEGG